MDLAQSLQVAARALRAAVSSFFRPSTWPPFLAVALVQAIVLVTLVAFHRSAVLPIGLPLVELLGGDEATHYPFLFFALPTMFSRANLVISALLASIAFGAATLLFARSFGFDAGAPWRVALRRGPTLIAISVIVIGLFIGLGYLRATFADSLGYSRPARWGVRGVNLAVFIAIQSLVVYTTAWVVLRGHSVWPAIRDSVRVTGRTLLPTLLVVGIPMLLLFPFSYAAGRVDFMITKFHPEVVTAFLATKLVFETLATFVIIGATTRLFLWRMEATA